MIESISLHNWKSHEDTSFKFEKGTNILVGPMGSGKSTVLDALCFALFGNFPALQHKRVKISDIIMNRPAKKDEAWVRLKFGWQGKEYEIERRITSEGGSTAMIRRQGVLVQGPQPQRVSEEVERMLRIDYDLFTRAVYSEQNGIDYFLTLGRGERKKQIDELLGISKFEVMRSNLSSVLNRLKGMQDDMRSLLGSMNVEKLRKEEEDTAAEMKKLEVEAASLGSKASEIGARKKSAESSLSRMLVVEKVYTELSERRGSIARTIENLEKEEAGKSAGISAEEIERAEDAGLGKIEDEIAESKKRIAQQTREIGSTNEKMRVAKEELEEREELERRIKKLGESPEELEERRKKLEKEVNDSRCGVELARRRVSELDEVISELGKQVANCPVCETPLENDKREMLLGKRKNERVRENEKISSLEKEVVEKEELLKSVSEKLKEAGEINDRIKKLQTKHDMDGLHSSLASADGKLRKDEEGLRAGEERRERVRTALEIKKSRLRIEELRKEGADVEGKLGEMKFDRTALESKRNEVRELSVEETRVMERIEGLKKEMGRVEEILRGKREEIGKYEKLGRELGRYGYLYESFAIFQNSIAETQAELREELIGAINSAMEEMWSTIYPYGDYQGVRLNAGEDDYELQLNAGGSWIGVDGIASGGERSSASIAMRMAFAMVLVPNLSWLILDEPTHNLDEEGIKALGKVLNEYIPKIVEQVFVITHDENLRDEASARVYHLWRNKEKNEPTKVESASI